MITTNRPLQVDAAWDDEAHVWIAASEDVPGLCAQTATFEELVEVVGGLIPDLLELNGLASKQAESIVPYLFKITGERSATTRLHT